MTENPLKLAVVIPAYNDEKLISVVLGNIPATIDEIIVVDDCSRDQTAAVVANLPDERIHLISLPKNGGVGCAVMTGYQRALADGMDVIIKMDSDDQMDPRYLPRLIEPIVSGRADFTKGNRFLHVTALKSMPLIRRIGNMAISLLFKLASGYWNIFDPTNGYTAIHQAVLRQLDLSVIDRRYFFETNLLVELGIHRAVVEDVFIPAQYGTETSKLSVRNTLMRFPRLLLKSAIRRFWIEYVVRDFSEVSLFLITGLGLFTFGFWFGLYHWIESIITGQVATTGTVMVATLPVMIGIQLMLQSLIEDIHHIPKQPVQNSHLPDMDELI